MFLSSCIALSRLPQETLFEPKCKSMEKLSSTCLFVSCLTCMPKKDLLRNEITIRHVNDTMVCDIGTLDADRDRG
jgi:hypothetical protein